MLKALLLSILIQGVLMSAVLDKIEINGIEIPIIFEKSETLPIVSMQIVFQKSGSIEDTIDGLAKFSSKMLNQGTKTLGNVAFAQKLEERAIHLATNCGTETMVIQISSLKEEFPYGIELLSELLKEPNLTEEAFEKVKTTTLGFLSRKENDYDYIAGVNLKKTLFENTPIGHPSNGTVESIKRLKLQDVKEFLQKHLVLKRAILVIGGDLDLRQAKEFAKKALQPLPAGSIEPLPFFEASKAQKTVTVQKETEQAYIYFGAPFYMRVESDELYLAKVASFILGSGGFGSRMMEEIRVKRGLAYSAYSRFNVNRSHSYFSGYLQTKLDSAQEAIKLVKELVGEFIEKGATQAELEAAVKFLTGSEPLRAETLSQRLSRAFNEYYRGHKLGYSKKELELIKKIDLDTLNRFIKKHSEIELMTFSIVTDKGDR